MALPLLSPSPNEETRLLRELNQKCRKKRLQEVRAAEFARSRALSQAAAESAVRKNKLQDANVAKSLSLTKALLQKAIRDLENAPCLHDAQRKAAKTNELESALNEERRRMCEKRELEQEKRSQLAARIELERKIAEKQNKLARNQSLLVSRKSKVPLPYFMSALRDPTVEEVQQTIAELNRPGTSRRPLWGSACNDESADAALPKMRAVRHTRAGCGISNYVSDHDGFSSAARISAAEAQLLEAKIAEKESQNARALQRAREAREFSRNVLRERAMLKSLAWVACLDSQHTHSKRTEAHWRVKQSRPTITESEAESHTPPADYAPSLEKSFEAAMQASVKSAGDSNCGIRAPILPPTPEPLPEPECTQQDNKCTDDSFMSAQESWSLSALVPDSPEQGKKSASETGSCAKTKRNLNATLDSWNTASFAEVLEEFSANFSHTPCASGERSKRSCAKAQQS